MKRYLGHSVCIPARDARACTNRIRNNPSPHFEARRPMDECVDTYHFEESESQSLSLSLTHTHTQREREGKGRKKRKGKEKESRAEDWGEK